MLPRPGPSLAAATVPPCISTSPLTSASPIPSPPVLRSMLRSTWENMSKMWGSDSAGMPIPVSLHRHHHLAAPSARRPARCARRGSVYLALLVSRLPNTWASRVRSASRNTGSGGQVDGQLVPGRVDRRAGRLDRAAHHVGQQDPGPPQLHLVAADPGHVEQVVDQPHHVARAAGPSSPGPAPAPPRSSRQADDLQAVADRGQRVPQLVGQQGEELVLLPVGLPQRVLGLPAARSRPGRCRAPDRPAAAPPPSKNARPRTRIHRTSPSVRMIRCSTSNVARPGRVERRADPAQHLVPVVRVEVGLHRQRTWCSSTASRRSPGPAR